MTAPLIAVVGPTASGKSELAVRLCQALNGEVISADSVQIYRRFDIGSAKPTARERAVVAHHLIDELDPLDAADVARFVRLADERIQDVRARGKRPIICGGTFLWVRALIYGLAPAPPADDTVRARHKAEADQFGREHLHERLREIDRSSYERLAPNDLVRVSRALEVYELTGTALSDLQARHGFQTPRHDVRLVGLKHERPLLDQRIEQRALQMLEQGWLEEVRGLLRDGYSEARALRSVGYRQVAQALATDEPIDMAALVVSVVRATRIFVRRQLTWLRDENVWWLTSTDLAAFTASVV